MPSETQSLARLIREVRTCFNQLKGISEITISDLDVTPSMRAVMEGLAVQAAAFTGPMWGIYIAPHLRLVGTLMARIMPRIGRGSLRQTGIQEVASEATGRSSKSSATNCWWSLR